MKQLCLSVEQMQKLKDLGLDINNASAFYYPHYKTWEDHRGQLHTEQNGYNPHPHLANSPLSELASYLFPAYTFQDILSILPETVRFGDVDYTFRMGKRCIFYEDVNGINPILCCVTDSSDDILIICYKALLWCLMSNYIETNKL